MRSITGYLLTRLVASAAFVLALAGAALYLTVTRALEAQFDRNLAERVQGFASILFQTEDEVEFEFSEQLMPEFDVGAEGPAYFELRFADGRLLERSSSLAGADLPVPAGVGSVPVFWSAPLPDGRAGRFVAQEIEVHHVYPEEGPERPEAARVRVVIARGQAELLRAEREVLLYVGGAFLVLSALIGAFSWLAVARGLEPAKRLAARIDAIQVERLPATLELGELPRELAPVAGKTDQLIRRVGLALERERRTTADIAHELRTPLSELLTVSEVALRGGEPQAAASALATVRAVAARMARSVATLLELARVEMGAARAASEPVDLAALLGELQRSLAAEAEERGLELAGSVVNGATVLGDREVLRIVLSNLLGNAVHYATPGTRVQCTFERSAPLWRLTVSNATAELSAEDLRSLSEPFWRKDRARSDRNHAGLGLALAHALAERAGLELSFALADGVFRASLSARGPARAG